MHKQTPSLLTKALAVFFHHLYHTLAPLYDAVAWLVSAGRWTHWVQEVARPAPAGKTLEIGFGSGHLQATLMQQGAPVFGIDESRQMAALASRRIRRSGQAPALARALGQALPFPADCFACIVATFPAPYIFHDETIVEIERTLHQDGQLIVLLAATPPPHNRLYRAVQWLFRIAGQLPPPQSTFAELAGRFSRRGMAAAVAWETRPSGRLLILQAAKHKTIE